MSAQHEFRKLIFIFCGLCIICFMPNGLFAAQAKSSKASKPETKTVAAKDLQQKTVKKTADETPVAPKIKVTFVELGSVGCIPCKMMQPIMKEIEKEYKDQVRVIFYDVWEPDGRPYAEKYKIRVIPTQVFLDENGKEYFRHEGFFPKEELIEVLKEKGVK
ncbi:thioredoxin [Candidatus Desantisbacteria bacterium CG_4_10_14_0_8_um_filter_48_22]|uniref:Thioredoxin n=1 Tax=Candidatus Desantisbacteria bacterium CG_4_10_14_0_8_um_filter_48_22 TaxID=1974543 RepID=A0A2M7S530_9BACT|nr:MAG: thioredoxin [Candidatus Desantisbacteria bacterium CG02_land_8_20_14_3_00_49_13]PIZ14634.1 MAG: thioredoxin [Candidatus Desantisbacteria bacterium CG_4_10_14_0_8_um_filter_48_22]